ncbi:hypothetical protein [uncultured Tateyamaria sp.]|uniref:hypothetical protein n=1 Tax=uncultured Tateyamaria sp. TaxID=455651 RepID=UPI002607E057|nr:hypothetical protein [uncultured Tateyamaria sp.]
MKHALLMLALFTLGACVDTLSETRGTFTDSETGRTYSSVTREFQRGDGSTYRRTTILVGGERVSCRAGDQRDCELALTDAFVRDRTN